ncbi:MAG TPA: tRNA-dihydrouridine synthase, partial [Vitreimonas sp.]|nr:tRNA-dihydrouridine synthase [Vitreimonas sp.]
RAALAQSGATGVMVGRAVQGKPWLPGAIEQALRHGGEVAPPPRTRLLQSLLELYEHTLAFYDHGLGLRIARKHIAWMIDAEFGADARETRKAICTMDDPARVRAALIELFDNEPMQEAA